MLGLFNLRPLDLTLSFVLAFVVFAFATIFQFDLYSLDRRMKRLLVLTENNFLINYGWKF